VRLYGHNAYDLTVRLAAIAAAAERITAETFMIAGEAVVRDLTVCRYWTSCADGRLGMLR
jgi:ATP-dependent DNA ligase